MKAATLSAGVALVTGAALLFFGCAAPVVTAPAEVPLQQASPCSDSTAEVSTAAGLWEALDTAEPGAVIVLAPGVYRGQFVATTAGTDADPISLCGPADAVLDGGGIDDGYVLHLDRVSNWILEGFTIRNGQKGLVADGVTATVIRGLTIDEMGDEGIHLRQFSTDNLVEANTVSDTGLRKPKYGEGIYIGTAEANWCDVSDCEPDKSDRNVISGNTVVRTTAEAVDIKEGTSDGVLRDNTFDGEQTTAADSWVDVKGNDWLIADNVGTNAPLDGFQTHEIIDGWGTNNTFRGNTATVDAGGFGYSLTPELANVVECDNVATKAGEGMSNVECTPR